MLNHLQIQFQYQQLTAANSGKNSSGYQQKSLGYPKLTLVMLSLDRSEFIDSSTHIRHILTGEW